MLKTAYQIGLAQALENIDVNALIKEARELGIPEEKVAFLGGLLSKGIGALGKGIGKATTWGAANPLAGSVAGHALGGAALGAGSAALTGGDIGRGALIGGLGGAGLGAAGGVSKIPQWGNQFKGWMNAGPAGSARAKFMGGFTHPNTPVQMPLPL